VPNLLAGRARDGGDERRRRDDLARCAEAALERVRADERIDQGMVAEPFDRCHLARADGVDERDAREHRHAVQLDGAGAAVALAAGDLRAGQAEVLAQGLRQRPADRGVERVVVPVDAKLRHRS
jgi:hypothetical protein